HRHTRIDPWFLHQIRDILAVEEKLRAVGSINQVQANPGAYAELIWEAKQNGFSDKQFAFLWTSYESEIRRLRQSLGGVPIYKRVDPCAAEFEAYTPYYYSAYERPASIPKSEIRNPKSEAHGSDFGFRISDLDDETKPSTGKERIIILGGGPNRIG